MLHVDFERAKRVEEALGSSIVALAHRAAAGVLTLEEMVAIMAHGLAGDMSQEELRALVMAKGLSQVLGEITDWFVALLRGEVRLEGPDEGEILAV
jgi:hypothetical protein